MQSDISKAKPNEHWLVWCDTNYEQEQLEKLLSPWCASIRGNDSDDRREKLLMKWESMELPILLTKPSIYGFGANMQFCKNMIFAGLSYSFEAYYQAVRRCWRFGQTEAVDVHIILAESEGAIHSAIARKEADFAAMRSGMSEAMRESTLEEFGLREGKTEYVPTTRVRLPSFLESSSG